LKCRLEQCKKEFICAGITIALLLAGVAFGVWKQPEKVYVLERPAFSEGEREDYLLVEDEEGQQQEIKVTVREKEYTPEEVEAFLEKAKTYVEIQALGNNESWDKIQDNLVFMTQLPDLPVEIYWDLGDEEYFDREGGLLFENIPSDGGETQVTAVLQCQEERLDVEISMKILPPVWTKEEIFRQSVEEAIQGTEQTKGGEDRIELPLYWQDKEISYYAGGTKKNTGVEWILFSLVAGAALYAALKKEEKEKQLRKRRELMAEYPAFIEKLLLFMGAGVSIRNIFFMLCQERRNGPLSEELLLAVKELKNGESEGGVYIRFGERVGLLPYVRLGVLLAQNLRSGTGEILEFLEREAQESFFERKEQAKQRGEEIGVKLLLPMGLLLFVTLAMIMIPAFLQL
jgi:hypothetical protein